MASGPAFAVTPKIGAGLVPATADTSRTAPTNATTILTGGSSGTKIERIIFQGVGTTVAGVVCLFAHDGSTYHLLDEVVVTATTPSTTVAAFRTERAYQDLTLPSSSWTLRVTTQIAGNQSLVKCTALGADL